MLLGTSKNVEDAKVFCTSITTTIKQAFNNKQKDIKVKDLELEKLIDIANPDAAKWLQVLEMFKEESIVDALLIIENMPYAIDSFIREEMSKRELKDLKATFLD